jgi:putative tricarboxylic transport membrane protein
MRSNQPFKITLAGAMAAGLALVLSTNALAADWKPTGPVTLIVPSRPGGGHDNNARTAAKVVEKHAGQSINVVNMKGGGGVVAYTKMDAAKKDGLTIGQISISVVSDQYRIEGVKYNQDSFDYIAQISGDPNNLVVNKEGPYGKMDVKEFVAFAKANPGKIRMGVSGNWTNHDYTRHQLEKTGGVKFQRVSIKGGSNIMLAILAGDVDAGLLYPSEIKSQYQAGKLSILAHNAATRLDLWPDVPTFTEAGLDINMPIWRVWVLPKGMPQNIIDGWVAIMTAAMNDPEMKKAYQNVGIGYAFNGPKETRAVIDRAHVRYKQIIDEAKIGKK